MVRKQVTSRFRGTDIFSRRIVITISRTGLLLIVFAVAVAVSASAVKFMTSVITIISVICAGVSIITTVEARHQLRNLRFEVRDKIVAYLDEWVHPDDIPHFDDDELDVEEDGEIAKGTVLRIPKSR